MKQGITDVIIWLLIAGTSSIIFWLLFTALGSEIKPSTDSPHIIPSPKTPAIRSDFCTTKGCTRAANVFLNSIDPTVDPCEDFYDFSCGGYAKNHHLPLNVESIMVGSDVEKSFMARMIDYLSHDSLESKPNIADRKAAKLFRLCMDIDKQGIQPFLPLIKEVGGPPFSKGVRPGWEKLIELLGFEQFPIWSTTFYLDNDMLVAPRSMSRRNDKVFVRKLIRMVTADMNMVWNETFVNSHLTDYINLLNEIEKISNNYIDVSINATGSSYFPLTIDEAAQKFPEIPWKAIVKHRFSPITRVFTHWNYVRDVYKLWQNSTLNNLMKDWYLLNFLEASLMQFGFEYSKLYEARYGSPRDTITFCRKTVEDYMPRWVDVFFWENVAKPQDYNSLNKFVATLREAWLENMRENDWIEPETKRNITERVAKIAFKYGFKVPLYTRKELDDLYAQYAPIDSPTFLQFTQASRTFGVNKSFRNFADETSVYKAGHFSFEAPVNHFYVGPLAIQEPFYASDYPLEVNYGSMGVIAAHELTHGFDPSNLNPSLLAGDDKQQYDERVKCIVDQFDNITVPTQSPSGTDHYNGRRVQGETISDNTGLRASFRAYRKERARLYGDHPVKLPGLEEYGGDQLFFMAFSQFFCAKETSKGRVINPHERHPLGKDRVNEGVKNFEAFGNAFSCKPNSPMNPQKKCRIWRHRHRRLL